MLDIVVVTRSDMVIEAIHLKTHQLKAHGFLFSSLCIRRDLVTWSRVILHLLAASTLPRTSLLTPILAWNAKRRLIPEIARLILRRLGPAILT